MRFIWTTLVAAFLASCGKGTEELEVHYPEDATLLSVGGMHCSTCKATIMRALAKVEGVEWAQVEVELGEVAWEGPAKEADIVAAIQEAGYEVGD